VAKVKFSGVREKPFYSTVKRLRLQAGNPLGISAESLEEIRRLKVLNPGGNLSVIELGQTDYRSEDLLNLTLLLFENQIAEFIAYNRAITYCCNCDKSWFGVLHKCPVCGAISTLTVFDRFSFS
jgi:anaerobic ribonucleoside-triphosphate reductase